MEALVIVIIMFLIQTFFRHIKEKSLRPNDIPIKEIKPIKKEIAPATIDEKQKEVERLNKMTRELEKSITKEEQNMKNELDKDGMQLIDELMQEIEEIEKEFVEPKQNNEPTTKEKSVEINLESDIWKDSVIGNDVPKQTARVTAKEHKEKLREERKNIQANEINENDTVKEVKEETVSQIKIEKFVEPPIFLDDVLAQKYTIDKITRYLNVNKHIRISSEAGTGKSVIANECMKIYEVKHKIWVSYSDNIKKELVNQIELNTKENKNQSFYDSMYSELLKFFAENKKDVLLVVDDVTDETIIEELSNTGIKLITTSRNDIHDYKVESIKVEDLRSQDAIDIFNYYYKQSYESRDSMRLREILGRLKSNPLAIKLLAITMRESGMSIENMFEEIKDKNVDFGRMGQYNQYDSQYNLEEAMCMQIPLIVDFSYLNNNDKTLINNVNKKIVEVDGDNVKRLIDKGVVELLTKGITSNNTIVKIVNTI